MDARLARLGEALWREDRALVLDAVRAVGAWPAMGLLLETVVVGRDERLFEVVADFVGFVRRRGWPRDAGRMMLYCERRGRADGAAALSAERKRRDAKPRPWIPQGSAALAVLDRAGLDLSGVVEQMRVPEERPLGSMGPNHWEMVRELDHMIENSNREKKLHG